MMGQHTIDTIRSDEGKSLYPYKDTLGNWTVGIGHKLTPQNWVPTTNPISEAKCERLFKKDCRKATEGAQRLLDLVGYYHEPTVLHVLSCMVFQLGFRGTKGFKRMLSALRARDYSLAADEMLDSKWARDDTPGRANRLADEMRLITLTQDARVRLTGTGASA